MEKWEIAKEYFERLIEKDYKKGSLQVVEQYFNDNIGMGEMYINLIQIRNDWYVANTDTMELMHIEDFAEILLKTAKYNETLMDWLEELYNKTYNNKNIYMSVRELKRDYIDILKSKVLYMNKEDLINEFGEENITNELIENLSECYCYFDISDNIIFELFDGINFVKEDFESGE